MDEKLETLKTEEDIEVSPDDIIESNIDIEDLEQSVEIEEVFDVVEVEGIDEIEVELDESVGWVGGDNTRHYSLFGRDEPDQHPIEAIIGLRGELDEIEALKTVYSNAIGTADFYKWNTGAYDEAGYFVSIVPKTSTIQICCGADVFGVTVDSAGFIGGQDADSPRGNTYARVATSGIVDVRSESDVDVGDYVISNTQGIATKTTSHCGYKVVAMNNKNGVNYATISLGVQACITDIIGKDIQRVQTRLDNAEINITSAMNAANAAYNKSIDSDVIAEEVKKQMQDAINKVEHVEETLGSVNKSTVSASIIAAQSKAIAESAITSAESIKNEAVARANDAWAKAGEVATEVYSLCANIDKYSVGEYSQAYGLTWEQARSILKEGMVYIPTVSHTEGDYAFSRNNLYVWTIIDTGAIWFETIGEVWLSEEQPAGAAYKYWYNGETLFALQGEQWTEVATLAGNVNNRITNMIRQDVNEISAEVVNARGSIASLTERVDDAEAIVQTTAEWVKGTSSDGNQLYNLATVKQSATDDGASLALVVADAEGNKILNGASIVLNNNDGRSSIFLDADCVNFDVGDFKIDASRIDLNGYATINDGFSIDENGYMHAIKGGTIGGFAIKDSSLHTNNKTAYNSTTAGVYIGADGIGLGAGKFYVTKDGHLTVKSGTIGGCQIDANGNLQIKNINIAEELVANSIEVKDSSSNGNILLSAKNNKVSIAGWNVDNNSFFSGDTFDSSDCFLCTGSTGNGRSIGGSDLIEGWTLKAGDHFGVTNEGVLYANSAHITGKITATAGAIGGWNVDEEKMWNDEETVYFYPDYLIAMGENFSNPVSWLNIAKAGNNISRGQTTSFTIDGKKYSFTDGVLTGVSG